MDPLSTETILYRLNLLESKLDGLHSGSLSVIGELKRSLQQETELEKLVSQLKATRLYRCVPGEEYATKGSRRNSETVAQDDRKLLILSNYSRLSHFLVQVDHVISLADNIDRFRVGYGEFAKVRESSQYTDEELLDMYEQRIRQPFEEGVKKCLTLLQTELSHTYERNLFLVQAYERLERCQ